MLAGVSPSCIKMLEHVVGIIVFITEMREAIHCILSGICHLALSYSFVNYPCIETSLGHLSSLFLNPFSTPFSLIFT